MLGEESLGSTCPAVVYAGVAPAIDKISPLTASPARMAGRLARGRAVINDVNFAGIVGTDKNLVQLRVVCDGIEVYPIRSAARGGAASRNVIDV